MDSRMSASSITARDMTKIALCVAFCCVTAYISFPLPFTPGMVTALTLALGFAIGCLPVVGVTTALCALVAVALRLLLLLRERVADDFFADGIL